MKLQVSAAGFDSSQETGGGRPEMGYGEYYVEPTRSQTWIP